MSASRAVQRIASVGFVNARPLIWGLEQQADLSLQLDVPSRLLHRVQDGSADVALLPAIDYQRDGSLRIIPVGGIGCDGHTLTVRLFAKQPIERSRVLACDPDSHTSVALAQIILAEKHGVRPILVPLEQATGADDEARLLIGDKVVCEEPVGFEHQYDLGFEWKQLTGLPFVFAVWMCRETTVLGELPQRLEQARREGLRHVDQIISRYAVPRGWPAGVALQYLTMYLKYEIGAPQHAAIERFHALAFRHGLLAESPRPLLDAR